MNFCGNAIMAIMVKPARPPLDWGNALTRNKTTTWSGLSCCGNEFCQVCIERVKKDGKPCPLCNEQNFTTLLHKKLVREVNALVIRCPQKERGCEWEGELGQLQRHLNPGAGVSSTQGCEFLMVECAYRCGAQLQRRLIQEHEMEACPKQPIEMQVASEFDEEI